MSHELKPPVLCTLHSRAPALCAAAAADSALLATDLALRSSSRAPQMALMERALIRLSMIARGRR